MEKIKVGIIFGGKSVEHEVSLRSAKNIYDALDKSKYEPILIGIDKNGKWLLNDNSEFLLNASDPKLIALNTKQNRAIALPAEGHGELAPIESGIKTRIDVAFPVLHGPLGEDGTVQGLLRLAGIPFVGSDVLGSAIGMDKDVAKRLLRDAHIAISKFVTITAQDIPEYKDVAQLLGKVLFIKPANLGSSVGVFKVHEESEYLPAVQEALKFDTKVLIEEFVKCREIECSVLGNENPTASIPGEVIPHHEFYSYEAKYIDENGAVLKIPAELSPEQIKQVQNLAIKTFKVLCLEGMARVDFFLNEAGEFLVNEVNTIPGFTSISMYPKLWEASGIGHTDLIDRLIQLAKERFEKDSRLITAH